MRVLIIGANGNTGRRIVRLLAEHDEHEPLAMIRNAKQKPTFDAMGVQSCFGDLEHPFDDCVAGSDAVIFAAGSGGSTGKDKTVLVDHLGAIRSMVAAAVNDAKRFIMLSGLASRPDAQTKITHFHRAKGRADDWLMQHHEVLDDEHLLNWTIVRPGGLHDEDNGGKVKLLDDTDQQDRKTSRDSLARVLVACLDADNTVGQCFGLIDGDTRVDEALAAR